ncbi:MAG: hypothetical protein ACM30I_11100 [Gemmatimonas sp.]
MCISAWQSVEKREGKLAFGRRMGLLGLTTAVVLAAPSAFATGLLGDWLTQDKDAALTIADCGGPLCGRIIWLETLQGRADRYDATTTTPIARSRGNGFAGSW